MRAGLLVCGDKCGPRKEGESGVAGSPGLQEVVCTWIRTQEEVKNMHSVKRN